MNNADRPTYPLQLQEGESSELISKLGNADGLTKREYFAAMAMQGLSSDPKLMFDCCPSGVIPSEFIAAQAVSVADALLKELDK